MAERLREGMDQVLEEEGVAGYVYGESSTFHIFLRSPSDEPVSDRSALHTLEPLVLKGMPPALITTLQNGFRARGMELMSYNGGMTCAAHTEEDIDETIAAFSNLTRELVERGQVALLT